MQVQNVSQMRLRGCVSIRTKGCIFKNHAAKHFEPSSRRSQVLHPDDLEMWASQACFVGRGSSTINLTGPKREMDRCVEQAEDLDELTEVILRHLEQASSPEHMYAPRTLNTALLRLTDWETADGHDSLSPSQRRAMEVLQCGVVAACSGGKSNGGNTGAVVDSSMVGDFLWSLATLHGADSESSTERPDREIKQGRLKEVCAAVSDWASQHFIEDEARGNTLTPDLTSMLWGFAALNKLAAGQITDSSSNAARFLDALATEMTHRLRYSETGRDLQPADLADTIWALQASGHRSQAVEELAVAVATEVFFQVSNRHSLKAPFTAPEVVKVVVSLSQLGVKSTAVGSALDAVAGHVVKRLKSRHVSAVQKPDDMLALLSAYADAGHISVVVPELVSATAGQLISDVAGHCLWLHDHGPSDSLGNHQAWAREYWQSNLHSSTITGLLRTYVRLNLYPGEVLMASLAIALQPQLQSTETEHLQSVMLDLNSLGHQQDSLQDLLHTELQKRSS